MWMEAKLCWDETTGGFWLVFQQPVFAELPLCVYSAKPSQAQPGTGQHLFRGRSAFCFSQSHRAG